MERKLSILLVEDDQIECKALMQYIDSLDDVFLVGVTNNSNKALEYTKDSVPDAIILDLELHTGGGNGLSFLQDLKNLNLQYLPYILITTNNTSPITYSHARKLGADFIMSKYQEDYSAQNVIDFLRSMKSSLHNKHRLQGLPTELTTTDSYEQLSKRILQRINSELNLVGISPKAIGNIYLTDAIQIIMNKPENNICAIIGKKYGKSDYSVERAIQNAINRAWRTSDIDDLSKHYTAKISSARGVPTINEFVFYYANKIKNDY